MTKDVEKSIKQGLRSACDRMRDDLRGYRVVLFGSRAAGSDRERSDFDVGILGSAPLPLKTFYQLENLFDEIETLHRIDLVDLNRVSSEFRREALKKTEALHG
ncbi:MAG: nucleotidyltransferase family protein [Syntrophales bacterium]